MSSNNWLAKTLTLAATLVGAVGCGSSAPPPSTARTTGTAATAVTAAAAKYLLDSEPAAAQGVKEVRDMAADADDVTMVGRIGGDANPWIDGQAAFLLVDCALKPCSEQSDDACPTPWDYCCDTDALPANKALVKVVDSSGATVASDARKLMGLKELQTIVVRGKAKRDEAGNLTVLAAGIFVRK